MYIRMMNKFIQINLNNCKATQDLLCQTAKEEEKDVIFISEYNKAGEQNWYGDNSGKTAIVDFTRIGMENQEKSKLGFRRTTINKMNMFSCYWSPNTPFDKFTDYL